MTDTPERALLRYFLEYTEDGLVDEENPQAPPHACDYRDNPESGYCEFHEKWADARALLATPPASEGEEYEVQNGYVDGVGHAWVCVCDLVRGLPPGQHVRVTRVAL